MFKKNLLLIFLAASVSSAAAQSGGAEATLKAAFIYNFTKYVDWEEPVNDGNFVIGIIGTSPVAEPLNRISVTNTVKNKLIIIKHFSKPEDIEDCNILFIPEKVSYPLSSILGKIGKGVLTISEEAGFAKQGTAFNFIIINDKLKFEANLKAIYSAGLKASSQLLKLAVIID